MTRTLTLVLQDEETDEQRLEEDLRDLLDEVAQLDGAEVDRLPGAAAPPGTRGGGVEQVGAALIALSSSGAILPVLLGLLQDWLGRRRSGSIHLKIGSDEVRIDRATTQMQKEALAAFLDRHRG